MMAIGRIENINIYITEKLSFSNPWEFSTGKERDW